MARVRTRIGNVFVVNLGEASKTYLQHITSNLAAERDSAVIEVYEAAKKVYQGPSRLDEVSKKYFQYIANDPHQLNSDVIRAFKRV